MSEKFYILKVRVNDNILLSKNKISILDYLKKKRVMGPSILIKK